MSSAAASSENDNLRSNTAAHHHESLADSASTAASAAAPAPPLNIPPPALDRTTSLTKLQTLVAEPVEQTVRAVKAAAKHRSFWVIVAAFLTWMLLPATILITPKVLHKTGITEKDHLEDFIYNQLVPFVEHQTTPVDPESRPGRILRRLGAQAKHPVFLVPGFITTGLELWEGEACAKKYFRQRMWGGMSMIHNIALDLDCWKRHLTLDPITGLDPPGIRLRAAQGFEAADYLVGNIWVWARLIENLADVGYSGSNMFMMAYDWRLSPKQLETRDSYFSMLKASIEVAVRARNAKAMILSHSMGSSHVFYFLQWVEKDVAQGGGGGGKGWVDKHVASTVNIAGAFLGAPKAMTAVISGEARDTAEVNRFDAWLEKIFGRARRQQMAATWGSVWTLFAKGGETVWPGNFITFRNSNNEDPAQLVPDDLKNVDPTATWISAKGCAADWEEAGASKSDLISMIEEFGKKNRTVTDFLHMISNWGSGNGKSFVDAVGVEVIESDCEGNRSSNCLGNPLVSPLWKGTDFKTYCLYGVGIPTELSYFYKRNPTKGDGVPWILDTSYNDPKENVRVGVKFTDGDATVPLASLGYMCRRGWVDGPFAKKLNPSKLKTVTREYPFVNERSFSDLGRGGPKAADHVDIMGNTQVIEDIVRIVTGFGDELGDVINSDIDRVADEIDERILFNTRLRK